MKLHEGKVWDSIRKRWLVLTPEEWVRQHLIEYLCGELGIEAHRIGREVSLTPKLRADLVVYSKQGTPLIVAECKAQAIPITQSTVEQIAGYNLSLGGSIPYLLITNGKQMYCLRLDTQSGRYIGIENLPQGL